MPTFQRRQFRRNFARTNRYRMHNVQFSLNDSPFRILNANFCSTAAQIFELVEDAELDGAEDEASLLKAQQTLVTPRTRLFAEVGWLPELSQPQINKVFDLIDRAASQTVLSRVDHFPEMAKANIAAHLCAYDDGSAHVIQFLVRAWDDVDARQLLEVINDGRRESGFPWVGESQLREALDEVRVAHAKSAAECVWRFSAPGVIMNEITEEELKRNATSVFLGLFLREYDLKCEPDLARIGDSIQSYVDFAKEAPGDLSSKVEAISDLLVEWDDINQPVQLYEQSRGHEEGRSKRLYEIVRDLCIVLANHHGQYDEALQLAEALLRTFPELDSVAESLRKDVTDLEVLAEQKEYSKQVAPLNSACECAKENLPTFSRSIKTDGFSERGRGALADLVTAFESARSSLEDPTVAFLMVRDLALFINNDRNDPETAFHLVHGLLGSAGTSGPVEVVAMLKEERSVLHKNWKMMELERQSGNPAAMSKIVDQMLEYASASDRQELCQLKSKIDRRKNSRNVKYAVYTVIAVVTVFFVLAEHFDKPKTQSFYQLPSKQTAPATTTRTKTNSYQEDIPPVGSGRTLTRTQVRYCVFQRKRIEHMRPLVNANHQVDRFNTLINDYNLRCSNFQYRAGVLGSIQSEASIRDSILRADARKIVSSW